MMGVSCVAWLGTWTKGRDESLNAREFKRTERRGVGSSITDDVFKSFSMQGSRVMEWEIENVRSKEKITAQLYVDENNFKEKR